ncbi:MAG: energy-coupling factor ABC transporter substrate-binding protein [Cyanobacteria bacterium]|nr:energy-coupling factor ABC transporter substrate-binding protein [Cyanobacteria bacterium bin.51]
MSKTNPPQRAQHNWLLVAGVLALSIFPLLFVRGEYAGADGQGQEAIETLHPSYEAWFEPLVELPSSEIESLLFASQAGLGAGVIGYVIGLYRGRSEGKSQTDSVPNPTGSGLTVAKRIVSKPKDEPSAP